MVNSSNPFLDVQQLAGQRKMPLDLQETFDQSCHGGIFTAQVTLGDFRAEAKGFSKKTARTLACSLLLEKVQHLQKPTKLAKPTGNKHKATVSDDHTQPDFGFGKPPCSRLAELQLARKSDPPVYSVEEKNNVFSIEVTLDGHTAIGRGSSKKEAKRRASASLLQVMGYNVSEKTLIEISASAQNNPQPEPKSPTESIRKPITKKKTRPVTQRQDHTRPDFGLGKDSTCRLSELQLARHQDQPEYRVVEAKVEGYSSLYSIEVSLDQHTAIGKGLTKKEAKRRAATNLLIMLGYAVTEEHLGESTSAQNNHIHEDTTKEKQCPFETREEEVCPNKTTEEEVCPLETTEEVCPNKTTEEVCPNQTTEEEVCPNKTTEEVCPNQTTEEEVCPLETTEEEVCSNETTEEEVCPKETTEEVCPNETTEEVCPNETTEEVVCPNETTEEVCPLETTEEEVCPNETREEEVCPNETTEEEVCPLETTKEEVCPNETREEEVCPNETREEEVCPNETTEEEVCPLETTEEKVCPNETTEEEVCPLETTKEEACPNETREEEVCPNETRENICALKSTEGTSVQDCCPQTSRPPLIIIGPEVERLVIRVMVKKMLSKVPVSKDICVWDHYSNIVSGLEKLALDQFRVPDGVVLKNKNVQKMGKAAAKDLISEYGSASNLLEKALRSEHTEFEKDAMNHLNTRLNAFLNRPKTGVARFFSSWNK